MHVPDYRQVTAFQGDSIVEDFVVIGLSIQGCFKKFGKWNVLSMYFLKAPCIV